MKRTRSGEYKLPGPLKGCLGNVLIHIAKCAPGAVRRRFLQRGSYYQVFNEEELGDQQGVSMNKWKAMQMPSNLSGKSVLDIGCADGFFCRLCAQKGAKMVLGIDSAIGRLLRARFMALEEGLNINYRIDVFPSRNLHRQFDYVLCLSVLHHSLVSKDLWKVLTDEQCVEDLSTLQNLLGVLKDLTAPGGSCVIEMPYEYDDPGERLEVDFERFNQELLKAGFRNATCFGTWEHNEKLKAKKDRLIYVAQA